MTNTDISYLLETLQQNEAHLMTTLEKVTDEEFVQKSASDKWSLAEIVEHIMLVDNSVMGGILAKGKNPPETIPETFPKEKLLRVSTARTTKVPAPKYAIPKGIFTTKTQALSAFREHRAKIETFVQTTNLPMERIAFKHFAFGLINGIGWITFMAAHSERHILQIKELLAEIN